MYQCNIEARPRNQCCFGKAKSVTNYMCCYTELSNKQSECGVFYCHLLLIPVVQKFSTLFKNGAIFGKRY